MLIVDYQPNWPKDFERIKTVLLQVLNEPSIRIEHVGSTSVRQLAAKPIIDMDVTYAEQFSFNEIRNQLESLGYQHVGDQGLAGREVFKRNHAVQRHSILDTITHHLYACHHKSTELRRHLAFRDILRENEVVRKTYEKLKYELAEKANHDKKKYALLKEELASEFIEGVLRVKGVGISQPKFLAHEINDFIKASDVS